MLLESVLTAELAYSRSVIPPVRLSVPPRLCWSLWTGLNSAVCKEEEGRGEGVAGCVPAVSHEQEHKFYEYTLTQDERKLGVLMPSVQYAEI